MINKTFVHHLGISGNLVLFLQISSPINTVELFWSRKEFCSSVSVQVTSVLPELQSLGGHMRSGCALDIA